MSPEQRDTLATKHKAGLPVRADQFMVAIGGAGTSAGKMPEDIKSKLYAHRNGEMLDAVTTARLEAAGYQLN